MKSFLAAFVTCSILCSSVVEMYDFDYCCLDCIPRSNHHIACRSELPQLPSSCQLFSKMSVDVLTDETTTSDDSSPDSDRMSSAETSSTPSNVTHVPVDNNPTSTTANNSTAHNTSAYHYRFKRQSSTDLRKNRVDEMGLLDAINEVRRNWAVNVSISNMEEIQYDEELGDIAEAVAKRCNSVKNFCADTPGFEVKMLTYNTTFNKNYKPTAQNVLDLWTKGRNEVLDKAKTDNIYQRSDDNTDSFTLLIWATTSMMGCADAINRQVNTQLNKTVTTYQITCLFGPAGNNIGQPMWENGEACSACPTGSLCAPYGELCTRQERQVWLLDKNRTSRCVGRREDSPSYDDAREQQETGRFRDFGTGVKVVLKPRKICDKISSSGTRAISRLWNIAAGFLLLHGNKWIARNIFYSTSKNKHF